ncbi:ATP-binding cassette sub-family A member 1-like [Tropilaelaps mercedesae]|uniref:ATP-binding cassette sub-family A member 1-like n=1 Tax=Tropilaelaps mercedesae TaxID=418985 RepID=A0A1V9WY30_9ACAR|nr:ATP-binding cassette sub-family A member 1-like [Tropilaelaps mercedesae]
MDYWRQLWAFFYKDFYIRKIKRHYIFAAFEVIVPAALLGLLVYLRYRSTDGTYPEWRGPNEYPSSALEVVFTHKGDKLAFAPNTNYTRSLAQHLDQKSSHRFELESYESWAELSNEIRLSNRTWVALNLERVTATKLDYLLSIDAPFQYSTKKYSQENAPRNVTFVERHTLYPLIWHVFEHFSWYYHQQNIKPPTIQPQPTGRYLHDLSFDKLARFLAQFLLFSYVIFVGVYPMQIIQEKSSRIRELLRMMGQPELVYWHGIFLTGLASMIFIAVMAVSLFVIPITGYALLARSNPVVVLVVLLTFSVAVILQLILISVLFNGPTMGAMVSILFWFLPLTLCTVLLDNKDSNTYMHTAAAVKLLTAMLPPCGCYWAFKLIGFWESANIGLQFSNLNQYAAPGDNITMLDLLLTFVGSSVLLSCLIFYLDAVLPWQYGIPKEPLFLFRKSYWIATTDKSKNLAPRAQDPSIFEPAPACADPVLSIEGVTKVFGREKVIDDLSVTFHRNQISVILGHNGAGKTTTMNILTGIFPPTLGDIFINGYSIQKETKKARESIGFCPQHNVLFDDLTVEEHLNYFAVIKKAKNFEHEIDDLLSQFNLAQKRHCLVKDLSGGMKRKLSMANAMVGGSRLLILDEPTAGMDPQARREVWSILQRARKTRTILLTTHYMEEADILGDRITFLSHGRLKCVGSPMFLKKKFNTGYKMRIEKTPRGDHVPALMATVTNQLADAVIEANMDQELLVNLGFPPMQALVDLFHHLEDNKPEYGIANLGVSVTTMEDVFLAVGSADEDTGQRTTSLAASSSSVVSSTLSVMNTSTFSLTSARVDTNEPFPQFPPMRGIALVQQQFVALFLKRFHTIKRQWWMPLLVFILPVLLTLVFCFLDEWVYRYQTQKTLTYSMNGIYGATNGWFSSSVEGNYTSIFDAIEIAMRDENVADTVIPEQNFSSYLLKKAQDDPLGYKISMMMGVHERTENLTLWVNDQPYHAAASALVILQRALLKRATGIEIDIQVATHPRDSSDAQLQSLQKLVWVRFVAVFPVSLATAFLTCSIILNPIQENISKAKLVQLMSGVSRVVYFGASFVFDAILLTLSSLVMLTVILIYNPLDSFTIFNDTWEAVLLIFLMYAYAMTPLSYMASYMFNKPATGFMYLLVFNVVAGSIIVVVMAMLDSLSLLPGNPFKLDIDAVDIFLHLLNYVPSFSVVWGFSNIHVNGLARDFCRDNRKIMETMCKDPNFSPFITPCCHACPTEQPHGENYTYCFEHTSALALYKREGAGLQLLALFSTGTTLFIILLLMECNTQRLLQLISSKIRRRRFSLPTLRGDSVSAQVETEDQDVHQERLDTTELVRSGLLANSDQALVVHDLTKVYDDFKAVNHISFRVKSEECFGLLGVNGAGKTTTFGMLTGDLLCSDGNAYIRDSSIRGSLTKFQRNIGYCPQSDALIDRMTGREMLHLFCALRGIPRCHIDYVTAFIIEMADLRAHADKTIDSCSIDNSPICRAFVFKPRSSSSRMCIMVNGQFRCIGSTQHLKSKFGEGFTVQIKLRAGQEHQASRVVKLLEHSFPGHVQLHDHHQSSLHFHVTNPLLRWDVLFQRVADIDRKIGFEDAFVSDTTLEQIFISFAKTQRDPERMVTGPVTA